MRSARADIEITDIEEELLDHPFDSAEKKSLFDSIKHLSVSYNFFRLCFDSYKCFLKGEDNKPLPYAKAQQLLLIIKKSRLLVNYIDEEYKVYEQSVEELLKNAKNAQSNPKLRPQLPATSLSKMPKNVFIRLTANTPHRVEQMERRSGGRNRVELMAYATQNDNEKLDSFIRQCLGKIVPKKTPFLPTTNRSSKKYGRTV